MKIIYIPLFSLFCLLQISISAQRSFYENSIEKQWSQIDEFPLHKLYGIAINNTESLKDKFYDPIIRARSSFKLNEDRSLDLLLEQYSFLTESQVKSEFAALIALKYFDEDNLNELISWSEKIDFEELDQNLVDQLNFKTGYAHLVNRNFENAYNFFNNNNSVYPVHNEYYLAMSNYYLKDMEAAIKGFNKVDKEWPYREYVPYYLTQIYFSQQDFVKTNSYGSKAINSSAIENKAHLYKLVGLANFELQDFSQANTYLEKYAKESEALTKEEFYQIAFTQYQLEKYDSSIENFKEISNLNDTLGTLANFYIADMYLKKNDLKAAQTAFSKLARVSKIKELTEDAEYNYALISVKLGDQRLALNTIKKMDVNHKHHKHSNKLLVQLLRDSDDYTAAMSFIEDLPSKNEELLKVYQQLSYKQAVLNFNDNTPLQSLSYFSIAASTPGIASTSAEAIFWQAYIHSKQANNMRAQSFLQDYFEFADKHDNIKKDLSFAKANYLQAYLYWNKQEYTKANTYFTNCVSSSNGLDVLKLSDANTRGGDYMLINNKYSQANKKYLAALSLDKKNDYAAYQLGLVAGLQKDPVDKIIILEEFAELYPKSIYRDNALFEIGNTYFSLGKKNNAIQSFDKFLGDYGFSSELSNQVLLKKGLISYNAGNTEEAIKAYTKVFDLGPSAEEQKQALTALEEIYITELNDPESYFALAENQGGLKIDDFTKDSISYAIAYEQFKNGEYDNAVSSFKKYRQNFKKGFYIVASSYYEGESNSLLKKYSEAANGYEAVIENKNNEFYQRALRKAAIIKYNQEQDYEKAFEYFDILIFEEKQEELEFITSGLICANLSNYESSVIKYANKLIQTEAASKEQKSTAYFYLAKSLLKKDSKEEAIMAFNKVIAMSSNNQAAEASFLVSKLFFNKGDLIKAETQALETTKRAKQYPFWVAKSLLLLGDIYILNKDIYNARAAIEATLENYTEDDAIISEANNKMKTLLELEKELNRITKPNDNNQIKLDTLTIERK